MSTSNQTNGSSFDCSVEDDLAHIHFHKGMFMLGPDLEEKERLFSVLADLDKVDKVKAVLLFDSADALSANEHRRYVDQLTSSVASGQYESALRMIECEINALTQYSMLATGFGKLLVSCHAGEIASPFFGVSLVSDFRLAAPNMSYRLSHVDLGLPPSAGLSFFLPKFIGYGRSTHWLLSGGTIDAEIAHHLGLVTAVMGESEFVEECSGWVRDALKFGTDHIKDTRRLIYRDFQAVYPDLAREEMQSARFALSKRTGAG
jgi:2-(1,2-epoxy-1,2-dihydrophenyl)acetyl-CoA isomerase